MASSSLSSGGCLYICVAFKLLLKCSSSLGFDLCLFPPTAGLLPDVLSADSSVVQSLFEKTKEEETIYKCKEVKFILFYIRFFIRMTQHVIIMYGVQQLV